MLCSTAYENPGLLSKRTPHTEVSLDNYINVFNVSSTQTETLSQKSLNQILTEVLIKAKFSGQSMQVTESIKLILVFPWHASMDTGNNWQEYNPELKTLGP